jgi:hypothetical protein
LERGYANFRESTFRNCLESSWTDSQWSTSGGCGGEMGLLLTLFVLWWEP